ncbi:MAG: KpsF/GutQ family sugar-phosphate isomerase [bacterium]|nr:KpsF/GutQ family sugar-phosphate isomerase [bacterium]
MNFDRDVALATARRVLDLESGALAQLSAQLDSTFCDACEMLLACKGRVIVSGMGKSGHIAHKIAASLASTGTPAYFLHAAEGVHGDLGVVHRGDVLLAFSFSGETAEIVELLPAIKALGAKVIAITGHAASTLAARADVVLLLGDLLEADPHNLVPTTSTTATLALGDALAVALMEARGFSPDDFAVLHPKGMLGKRLTLLVRDLLRGAETNPVVAHSATFGEALGAITRFKLGGVSISGPDGELAGILTDGDVRRIIEKFAEDGGTVEQMMALPVGELMTTSPTAVHSETLASQALSMMENHQPRPIFIVPVYELDGEKRVPVGMLHLHALVQAGFKASHSLED